MLQQEIFSSQWCYTHFLSFFHIVPLSLFSRLPFHLPLPPHPPFYSDIFCSYLYYYLITSQILRDITLLVSSPPLSWNSDFRWLFVLFKLFYLYLMRQKLGKNLIINAEAKIFNLLACSGSFSRLQESLENHTWIIHASYLE